MLLHMLYCQFIHAKTRKEAKLLGGWSKTIKSMGSLVKTIRLTQGCPNTYENKKIIAMSLAYFNLMNHCLTIFIFPDEIR